MGGWHGGSCRSPAAAAKLPVGAQLGPGGAVGSRPMAAAEPAFDALAAQAPGNATWADVGRPVAALPGAPWAWRPARSGQRQRAGGSSRWGACNGG